MTLAKRITRTYTPEFKHEAVLDPDSSTFRAWVAAAHPATRSNRDRRGSRPRHSPERAARLAQSNQRHAGSRPQLHLAR
jgi:hypothetical protein